jgi:lauroyl/myristoyl acyltransferase
VTGDDRRAVAAELTQRVTGFYEDVIRAYPECWLWSYKRWRYISPGQHPEDYPAYARPVNLS